MSFDFSTLVTDRTQADVNRVKQIAEKIKNGTASESELAEFNSAAMKGAYNYTDLNRVTAAMEALKAKLEGYGYAVPGYQRIKVPHPSAGGGSRLPEGYTELAWIESTGAQWVDTEFKPNQDTKVVMDVQSVGVNTNDTGQSFFGARTASSNMFAAYWHRNNVAYYIFYNDGNSTVASDRLTNRMTVTMDKNTLYVSDALSVSRAYAAFSCDYTLFLFASNVSGTADYFGINKVYSCQIYDNGTLVRDFVPCKNSGGVVGLYDLANDVFYQNAGSGAFTAGEEIAPPADVPIVDEYDPHLWYEFDWPTTGAMTVYLLNVSALRSVFAVMKSTPSAPKDAVGLMVQEANNIEKILVDINELLMKSTQVWFYSGDLFTGEV